MKKSFLIVSVVLASALGGCATSPIEPKDYSAFHRTAPRSILVVPVVNHSNEVDASDLFLTTLALPLAERGYYVFPTNTSKKLMEAEGLGDPGLVHQASTPDVARVFGADSILYVEVLDWKSKYQIVSSNIEVEFLYTLKSGQSGEVLWQDQQRYVYSASANSGNIFADLIVNAVKAAIDNTRSDFTPLAMQANVAVIAPAGQGLPFGQRSPLVRDNDSQFPATGSGKISDATQEALAAPGVHAPEPTTD